MTPFKLVSTSSIALLLSISPGLAADLYKVDSAHTSVVFSVAHNGLSYTYGFFRDAKGQYQLDKSNPANCRFVMLIQADSLDTNNAERDKHLRSQDFFDVQQFPTIRFDSTRCELVNAPEGGVVYKVTGDLTIHGVKRPVNNILLHMLGERPGADKTDHRTGFWCQIELKRSDYGMTNLLQDNLVGDAVGVTVSFEGSLQNVAAAAPQTNP